MSNNARKALRVVTAATALGTSASVYHKDREYFRRVVWGSAAVSVPYLFFGGLWSYVRNNPFFSKYVLLNSVSLSLGTYAFFTFRGFLEKKESTQLFLPDRERVFYEHALSVGGATFVATSFYCVAASDVFSTLRAGLIIGCTAGFIGQSAYELLVWWWKKEYRKQAIKLHFPYVWEEMQKTQPTGWFLDRRDQEYSNANLYILNWLRDFYATITMAKSAVVEQELQMVDAQVQAATAEIENLELQLKMGLYALELYCKPISLKDISGTKYLAKAYLMILSAGRKKIIEKRNMPSWTYWFKFVDEESEDVQIMVVIAD